MIALRTIEITFWISLIVVFYTYIGYGIILYIYLKVSSKKKKVTPNNYFPDTTLIVAAYNEEDFIEKKIKNSLALDYPLHKLCILFITDGSTDATPVLIKKYDQIQLLHQTERKGKAAALNRAMRFVKTPIVIFTDANTLLNEDCIRQIVKHYSDKIIGGVAGEKKIITNRTTSAAEAGEGIYWKYESFLKKQDSDFYTVVGAAGELFSIRSELFEELEEDTLLDDFVISLRICKKGYRVAYEPNAYAIETASASMKEEQKRKIRISAGGIQAIIRLQELLNPFKNWRLFFQYVSHRVLRWTVCPVLLPVVFLTNALLAINTQNAIYQVLFYSQCIFYLSAVIGWLLANKNIKVKLLYIPYYFVFMNASTYIGFFNYINNTHSVLWEKAARNKRA